MTIDLEASAVLELPLVPADASEVSFSPPESFLSGVSSTERNSDRGRTVAIDLGTGRTVVRWQECGIEYEIQESDPLSARLSCSSESGDEDACSVDVSCSMRADPTTFFHDAHLVARYRGEIVADRRFSYAHPRDFN